MTHSPVAVIAADPADRADLHEHLRSLGFETHPAATLARAGTNRVVVCVRDRADAHLLAGLPAYCARTRWRIVVITRWPALVRAAAAAQADALDVLVPPLLLGQLADALRPDGALR